MFLAQNGYLFLGQLCHDTFFFHPFEPFQATDAFLDGFMVCEHTAQPSVVDKIHSAPFGFFADSFPSLPFCTDQQDGPIVADRIPDKIVCPVNLFDGFAQIDYVDTVALTENERSHFRVPPPRLVPEVNTCFEQLSHCDYCHTILAPLVLMG
jgi:hypothetical protein